jgi:hypothetical protein
VISSLHIFWTSVFFLNLPRVPNVPPISSYACHHPKIMRIHWTKFCITRESAFATPRQLRDCWLKQETKDDLEDSMWKIKLELVNKRPICLISSNHYILMVKNTSMSTESLAETMICSALAEVHKVHERYSVTRVDIKTSRTWVSVSFVWLVFKVAFKMSVKRAKTQRQGIRYNIPKVQEWYSKSILTKLIRDIHLRNINYNSITEN